MKTQKRFILGLASAILLSCGWIRAAELLDPTGQEFATPRQDSSAPSCIFNCGEDTLIEHDLR